MKEGLPYQDESALPLAQRGSGWFITNFEQKMASLDPYGDEKKFATIYFGTDAVKLIPDKLVAAIVHYFNDGRFEILLAKKQASGYSLGDHDQILEEFNLPHRSDGNFWSILFEAAETRYVISGGVFSRNNTHIIDTLLKYKINKLYSIDLKRGSYVLNPRSETTISIDNCVNAADILISDDWKAGIAQKYGWTNSEWLRFKMVGEVPEWKRPRYK